VKRHNSNLSASASLLSRDKCTNRSSGRHGAQVAWRAYRNKAVGARRKPAPVHAPSLPAQETAESGRSIIAARDDAEAVTPAQRPAAASTSRHQITNGARCSCAQKPNLDRCRYGRCAPDGVEDKASRSARALLGSVFLPAGLRHPRRICCINRVFAALFVPRAYTPNRAQNQLPGPDRELAVTQRQHRHLHLEKSAQRPFKYTA
jgi:hypothetical protein